MTYRGAAPDDLVVRELDGFQLLYHRPSGETHLLAEELSAILGVIAAAPAGPDDVAARLAQGYDLDADEGDVRAAIAARLDELVRLGLADRVG